MKTKTIEVIIKIIDAVVIGVLTCVIKALVASWLFIEITKSVSNNTNIYVKEFGFWDSFLFLLMLSCLIDMFFKSDKTKDA